MKQLLVLLILVTLVSCKKGRLFATEGVVIDFSLDGCTWQIEAEEDGETVRFQPMNLDEFDVEPRDGLEVKFRYKPTGGSPFCMSGRGIELLSLKER